MSSTNKAIALNRAWRVVVNNTHYLYRTKLGVFWRILVTNFRSDRVVIYSTRNLEPNPNVRLQPPPV